MDENKNEIMEMENETMEPEEEISEETTSKSLPTGIAIGIGAGLALLGVKAYKFIKNRRAMQKASEESKGNIIDITDEVETVEDDEK